MLENLETRRLLALVDPGVLPAVEQTTDVPLEFIKLARNAGSQGTTGVYRADLTGVGVDFIRSITIRDNSSGLGGAPGEFSGFDLDGIILSNDFVTDARLIDNAVRIEAFDYYEASFFEPGTQRPPIDEKLQGTLDDGVSVDPAATLDLFDSTGITTGPVDSISLGDNGIITFDLTRDVSTDGLYLYIGEGADNGEVAASSITVRTTPSRPVPPTVASLTVSPEPVTRGQTVTLTAGGVDDSDGDVEVVNFFRDGTLVGSDDDGDDGWSIDLGTSGLEAGTYAYSAVATDDDGAVSAAATATSTVVEDDVPPPPDERPTIDGLVASPNPAEFGSTVTLTALGVADDGDVAQVEFFLQDNTSNLLLSVGVDVDGSNGWSVTTTAPPDFDDGGDVDPAGERFFSAIATDDGGRVSDEAATRLVITGPVTPPPPPPPPPADDLAFTFLDAGADVRLFAIEDGATYGRSELPANLSVEADNVDSDAESVAWRLVGPGGLVYENTENISFYTLFRNLGTAYQGSADVLGAALPAGTYTLTATSYLADNAAGGADETGSVTFTIADDATPGDGPAVTSLDLVDADGDAVVAALTDGATFTVGEVPANASVLASAAASAGSVRFVLAGPGGLAVDRVENVAAFTLFANEGGDFFGQPLGVESYTLSVTAYAGDDASGASGEPLSVAFEIVDDAVVA